MRATRQRGFTLIELAVVITILGILAAFAVPKFLTIDSSARSADINGLAGTVRSAAALAHGMSMATGAASAVTMEGSSVALVNRYPDAASRGIIAAVNTNSGDFTVTGGASASGTVTWTKPGATSPTSCQVAYTPPAYAGVAPTIVVTTSGC